MTIRPQERLRLRKKNSTSRQEKGRACLLCFQDAPLLDWGMSRRQVLGAGSAFFAAATFGGATANDQIAPPSRSSGPPQRGPHNVVFSNAHVIDPESGLSDVRNVGVTRDKIAKISADALHGDEIIDAKGLVLAPGFVDIHCHAPITPSMRLAALDGVTTALELELGGLPIPLAYAQTEADGRPINFGYSFHGLWRARKSWTECSSTGEA